DHHPANVLEAWVRDVEGIVYDDDVLHVTKRAHRIEVFLDDVYAGEGQGPGAGWIVAKGTLEGATARCPHLETRSKLLVRKRAPVDEVLIQRVVLGNNLRALQLIVFKIG